MYTFLKKNIFFFLSFTLLLLFLAWKHWPQYVSNEALMHENFLLSKKFDINTVYDISTPIKKIKFSERLENKKTILYFFSTWCFVCKTQLGVIKKIYESREAKEFNLYGISSETLEVLKAYKKNKNIPFPILQDSKEELHELLKVSGYPTTFIIEKDGRISNISNGLDLLLWFKVRGWL